eukprot:c12420_g1_i1.p1 GENE.c12420_g1_i1~~c12420_g1_i1.p1  ORF type:complete len:369 (+),score=57.07 c12420_g1_i1:39-1145(+)
MDDRRNKIFVAVHAGAGFHSEKRSQTYKNLMKNACLEAIEAFCATGSCVAAVVAATKCLENHVLTNAGVGSSLNMLGEVQCDACLVDGESGRSGAVGALSGVINPILVADRILSEQPDPQPCGLVRPMFLVGEGARQYAVQRGIAETIPSNLVTPRTTRRWGEYKGRLERATKAKPTQIHTKPSGDGEDVLFDTVGAIACDWTGRVASAVSSGGVPLKTPGRVGEAGIVGAGAYAEMRVPEDHPVQASACSVSGVGEAVMLRFGALRVVEGLLNGGDGLTVARNIVTSSKQTAHLPNDKFGIIALLFDASQATVEFVCAHNTPSMAYASYCPATQSAPSCCISVSEVNAEVCLVSALRTTFPQSQTPV